MLDRKLTIPAHSEYQVRGKVKRIIVRSALYDFEVETERGESVALKEGDNFVLEEDANVLHIKNNTASENKIGLTLSYTSEGNLESSAGVVKLSGADSENGALKTQLANVDAENGVLKTQLANVDAENGALKIKIDGVEARYNSIPVRLVERKTKTNLKRVIYTNNSEKIRIARVLNFNNKRTKAILKLRKILYKKENECFFAVYVGNLQADKNIVLKGSPERSFLSVSDSERLRLYKCFDPGNNTNNLIFESDEMEFVGEQEVWIIASDPTDDKYNKMYDFSVTEHQYV